LAGANERRVWRPTGSLEEGKWREVGFADRLVGAEATRPEGPGLAQLDQGPDPGFEPAELLPAEDGRLDHEAQEAKDQGQEADGHGGPHRVPERISQAPPDRPH
jgi:hypothetical protein